MNYDFDERISNKKWNCNIWNKADSIKDENLETIRMFFIRNCDSPKFKDDRIKNHRLKQIDSSLFLALAQIRMKRPQTAAPGLETPPKPQLLGWIAPKPQLLDWNRPRTAAPRG